MKLVHFSKREIKRFEEKENRLNAVYFIEDAEIVSLMGDERCSYFSDLQERYAEMYESNFYHFGALYGGIVNLFEIDDNANVLDLSSSLPEFILEFLGMDDEDDALELIRYDEDIQAQINRLAKEKGYDVIVYKDYTEGEEHKSYAVLNYSIIKNK